MKSDVDKTQVPVEPVENRVKVRVSYLKDGEPVDYEGTILTDAIVSKDRQWGTRIGPFVVHGQKCYLMLDCVEHPRTLLVSKILDIVELS